MLGGGCILFERREIVGKFADMEFILNIMKKLIICLIVIVSISLICIAKTYNMTNVKSDEFYGDDALINELSKEHNDAIVANAIYVSPEGNDAYDGTLDSLFKTIQKALDTVKAGGTIYVREGSYSALNTFS